MKKILVVVSFLVISLLRFSEINDNLNLFSESQKKIIGEKIEEISEEKNISTYINTFNEDIGFIVSNPEKAFILNLKKMSEDDYKVEASFSKDIDIEGNRIEIEEVLVEGSKLLENKNYYEYIIMILDTVGTVLGEVDISKLDNRKMTVENKKMCRGSTCYILGALFLVVLFLLLVFRKRFFEVIKNIKNLNRYLG